MKVTLLLIIFTDTHNSVPVIVSGNFTDSEEDVPIPESGREYPLQRDEVKSTSKAMDSVVGPSTNAGTQEEPKHYIGFVIGILTVVILILVAAIVFIVFRNQRLKAAAALSVIPVIRNDLKRFESEKVSKQIVFYLFFLIYSFRNNTDYYIERKKLLF